MLIFFFSISGLIDMTTDPDYRYIYDEIDKEGQHGDPSFLEERRFFMKFIEDYIMTLYFHQNSVEYYNNMFFMDAEWTVKSAVKLLEDQVDRPGKIRSPQQVIFIFLLPTTCTYTI